jgi:hypothetical protein
MNINNHTKVVRGRACLTARHGFDANALQVSCQDKAHTFILQPNGLIRHEIKAPEADMDRWGTGNIPPSSGFCILGPSTNKFSFQHSLFNFLVYPTCTRIELRQEVSLLSRNEVASVLQASCHCGAHTFILYPGKLFYSGIEALYSLCWTGGGTDYFPPVREFATPVSSSYHIGLHDVFCFCWCTQYPV